MMFDAGDIVNRRGKLYTVLGATIPQNTVNLRSVVGDIMWTEPITNIRRATKKEQANFLKDKIKNFPRSASKTNDTQATTGADPEVFVNAGNGTVLPAFMFLKDKSTAERARQRAGGGEIPYWDGFQAEWNVQPGFCHAYVVDSFRRGLENILTAARKVDSSARLSPAPLVSIEEELLRKTPLKFAKLGCKPSKTVYDDKPVWVDDPFALPYRFAGCHIHFGIGLSASQTRNVVKALDSLVGVVSVPLLRELDDPRRRMFYGRAGEYRTPSHGLEYRSVSSAVLYHPVLVHLMLDLARFTLGLGKQNIMKGLWKASEDEVRRVINEGDVELALKVLARKRNKETLDVALSRIYGEPWLDGLYKLILRGAKETFKTTMETAWRLDGRPWYNHSAGENSCVKTWKV